MKVNPRETYAKELYTQLEERFSQTLPKVTFTIEGVGVNWKCTATRENSFCKIPCYHYPQDNRREYAIYFERDGKQVAAGRTPSLEDAVNAIDQWLYDAVLSEMYNHFEFVDKNKRAMQNIETEILAICPELAECSSIEHRHEYGDAYYLWLSTHERACHFAFWGRDKLPNCFFDWDKCNLFKGQQGNIEQLAWAIKRWLCDSAMPSEMESEFSWLNFGKLGYYYEQGRGIEGEFIVSWDKIMKFYPKRKHPRVLEVLEFISQLRQKSYDLSLRAGQSLFTLILSRSRRHGLKPEQPSIAFGFGKSGLSVDVDIDGSETFHFPNIEVNEQIETALKRLEAKKID